MARSGSTTLTLPPFDGTVRQIVIVNLTVFFAALVLNLVLPEFTQALLGHLVLQPAAIVTWPFHLWTPVTYSFLNLGILNILFSMLMVWMFGSMLEGSYGARFTREVYLASAIGGALLATAGSFTHVLGLRPESVGVGAESAVFGIMVALAVRMGDVEILLMLPPVRIRIKYLVGIYVLLDLAYLLRSMDSFGALLHLSAGLCSFLYVNYAPSQGLGFAFSERFFGVRNSYYRYKRRRAARKFEVYMGKQGRKVQFDEEGRYLDPDSQKDPNDKRWMN
ncbi:MAG TPA: rhomboid family intramembrane serine protease [Acidobacteriaceae bacterium]|jgi:membrane associated rhomboid family serine protease